MLDDKTTSEGQSCQHNYFAPPLPAVQAQANGVFGVLGIASGVLRVDAEAARPRPAR